MKNAPRCKIKLLGWIALLTAQVGFVGCSVPDGGITFDGTVELLQAPQLHWIAEGGESSAVVAGPAQFRLSLDQNVAVLISGEKKFPFQLPSVLPDGTNEHEATLEVSGESTGQNVPMRISIVSVELSSSPAERNQACTTAGAFYHSDLRGRLVYGYSPSCRGRRRVTYTRHEMRTDLTAAFGSVAQFTGSNFWVNETDAVRGICVL